MKKPKIHFKRTKLRGANPSSDPNSPNPKALGRYRARKGMPVRKLDSAVTVFTRGFLGSFRLAANAVKAVGSAGGRFINDDEEETQKARASI